MKGGEVYLEQAAVMKDSSNVWWEQEAHLSCGCGYIGVWFEMTSCFCVEGPWDFYDIVSFSNFLPTLLSIPSSGQPVNVVVQVRPPCPPTLHPPTPPPSPRASHSSPFICTSRLAPFIWTMWATRWSDGTWTAALFLLWWTESCWQAAAERQRSACAFEVQQTLKEKRKEKNKQFQEQHQGPLHNYWRPRDVLLISIKAQEFSLLFFFSLL